MSRSKQKHPVMVPVQSKMARAATGLRIEDISKNAQVSTATVVRFERGEELKPRTIQAIQRAYEDAGIEFLPGPAPGIRIHAKAERGKKAKR